MRLRWAGTFVVFRTAELVRRRRDSSSASCKQGTQRVRASHEGAKNRRRRKQKLITGPLVGISALWPAGQRACQMAGQVWASRQDCDSGKHDEVWIGRE